MSKIALRNFWFQFHKWIGLLLAILIIPICITGSALVWHDALDKALNPQRHAFTSEQAKLEPSAYAAAAQSVLAPGERIVSLRFAEGEPVMVAAAQPRKEGPGSRPAGRPGRTVVYMDPGTAKVLDKADGNAGLVRFMHGLHGSLLVPGVGRQIVGWIGVAMVISTVSGIWLWWPTVGSWLKGLRWKRHRNFDTNLHHQMGFWIALPLFVLSLTGAWISFPAFFGAFSGEAQRARPGQPDRMAMMRAKPLAAPATSLDQAVATSRALTTGQVTSVNWPTDLKPEWSVSFNGKTVAVEDASGAAKLDKPRENRETTARLMRRIHDGTDMGLFWQIVIFIGGIIPAILAITGIIMWLRARKWRGELARRQKRKPAIA
ncbi:MAG: PepSY-associated TM helix domain-containing protein [Sphingobium sp.]|uniref:PepSY-associated TM helix domain-containing protein n=1 Tax=Sphingobium sp. TaxID=1912891 RepID=UPI0029A0F971|nr:PepSY-associated TM helix domain-containing protein [Sphingobium sp.]MDX3911337.1 PepSY-associated TM helix domain-containing protein [Sphingobium sp.]